MPDLFSVDDLEGAVMPNMTICMNAGCEKAGKCQRHFKRWPGKLGDPQQSFISPDAHRCASYNPIPKAKDMSMKQEPLPDRKISGKVWHMWLERHGRSWMAFKDNITHSYGTDQSQEAAIAGCVAQVERIYGKSLPTVDLDGMSMAGEA
jgi:hypothetical protein